MTADAHAAPRIRSALVCFAAGDALGVPWEGCAPGDVDAGAVDEVPVRPGWPRGCTSDDTAQLLLLAAHLVDGGGEVDEAGFARRLAAAAPGIRGIGPTTAEALRRLAATGRIEGGTGATNGAAMRAPAAGWAVASDDAGRRRDVAARLARSTHAHPDAIAAACAVAAMAGVTAGGGPVEEAVAAAVAECPAPGVADAAGGRWSPPAGGVPFDAVVTVAAVVHVLRLGLDVAGSLRAAIALGGDTDTVAAIVGGVLGAVDPGAAGSLPWLGLLDLPGDDVLDRLAAGLAALRDRG